MIFFHANSDKGFVRCCVEVFAIVNWCEMLCRGVSYCNEL